MDSTTQNDTSASPKNTSQYQLNIAEIRGFFAFLAGTKNYERMYFNSCLLDEHSKEQVKGYGVLYSKVETLLATLQEFSAVKPTLHTTLNIGKHTGRRTQDMVASRVLCVDLDRDVTNEELAEIYDNYKPHLVVKSSPHPRKYHLYWRIESIPLETWSKYQLALGYLFKGDLNLDNVAKTIRVPGVPRATKTGEVYTPTIISNLPDLADISSDESLKPLSYTQIGELFPSIDAVYEEAIAYKREAAERLKSELKELRKKTKKKQSDVQSAAGTDTDSPAEPSIDPALAGRNTTLWNEVYREIVTNKELSSEEDVERVRVDVTAYAQEINQSFSSSAGGALDESEFSLVLESAFKTATSKVLENAEKRKEKRESQAVIDKELLRKIEEISSTPTNGDGKLFEYDYSKGALAEGRFTTLATVERVFQRYGKYMIEVDGEIYAYNFKTSTWTPQKQHNGYSVISEFVYTCCRDMLRDPTFVTRFKGDDAAKKIEQAVDRALSHNFVSGVKSQVLGLRWMKKSDSSSFDANPNLLYCANGVLNLEDGSIREATPQDYLLRRSGAVYDASADWTQWEQFVRELFADNDNPEEMVSFMQLVFGYTLTGSIDAQKIFIHYGGGSNGKSKIMEALKLLAGDYGTLLAGATLAKNPNALQKEMERIGAKIESKRVVIIDDLDTKTQWNEGLVKNLTGRSIMARKLYAEERDIPNRAKFHIGCNDKPTPQSENFGILRRLCIIPYLRTFEPNLVKEAQIMEMMDSGLSGVLNWAILGAKRLFNDGFREPEECVWSLEEYKQEHFTGEAAIETLFERPFGVAPKGAEIGGDSRAKWYSLKELVEYVNEHFEKRGMLGKKVSNDKLGGILRGQLKLEHKRSMERDGRHTRYWVVLREQGEEGVLGLDKLK
jgi:P4 family phage/plasmid primase-like protien